MAEELRIVSLIASATEIVAALGLDAQLVGISHECDYPPSVTSLPVCSRPRIDIHASSRAIDDAVREALSGGVSVYELNTDVLRELDPTHIITQSQCEVCAVNLEDVTQTLREAVGLTPEVVVCHPVSLADVWSDIERIADALGYANVGRAVVEQCAARLKSLAVSYSPIEERKTVLCVEWADPLMVAGLWVPELVRIAGGQPVCVPPPGTHPTVKWADVREADPDVIVLMPCGYDIARARRDLHLLAVRDGWEDLTAVKSGNVFVCDGNAFFNRPGPRLVESALILRDVVTGPPWNSGLDDVGFEVAELDGLL